MNQDQLSNIKVHFADFRLKCCGEFCDRELQSTTDGLADEGEYIYLRDAIEWIESDNGWDSGLCDVCFTEKEKWELIYERAEMEIKSQREECAR
jgi:hypothetical protein